MQVEPQAGYERARADVQRLVPLDARSALDLGCANGALGAALKRRQDITVVGVELLAEYAEQARERLDRVIHADLDSFLAGDVPPEAPFDCLIAADVLEHLVDPWATLKAAAGLLRPSGVAVVSVPNVLELKGLLRVVRERRWLRESEGPFDRTHLRWFSRSDVVDLLEQAGLVVESVVPSYWASGWRLRWRVAAERTPLRDFVAVQYLVTGRRGD